jgi:ATP-binding cassette subfamily B protein RaxB
MFFLQNLRFGIRRKLPVILQTEASECALACLGMVAGFHGHYIDLIELRKTHSISL